MTMLAFLNTEVTKPQLLGSLTAHREADRIVQRAYWEGGRGCAVGCSIHDFRPGHESNHALYPELFGIPEALAYLEDRLFEALPTDLAREWPLRFVRAIPEGADLTRVPPRVLRRMQHRNRERVVGLTGLPDAIRAQVLAAIDGVLAVLDEWARTGVFPEYAAGYAAWSAARSAARSASEYAAGYAAWSASDASDAAAWSARSAARSAESAAGYAAWSAARSAARSASEYAARYAAWSASDASDAAAWSARSAARSAESAARFAEVQQIADDLVAELEAAPVPAGGPPKEGE